MINYIEKEQLLPACSFFLLSWSRWSRVLFAPAEKKNVRHDMVYPERPTTSDGCVGYCRRSRKQPIANANPWRTELRTGKGARGTLDRRSVVHTVYRCRRLRSVFFALFFCDLIGGATTTPPMGSLVTPCFLWNFSAFFAQKVLTLSITGFIIKLTFCWGCKL